MVAGNGPEAPLAGTGPPGALDEGSITVCSPGSAGRYDPVHNMAQLFAGRNETFASVPAGGSSR